MGFWLQHQQSIPLHGMKGAGVGTANEAFFAHALTPFIAVIAVNSEPLLAECATRLGGAFILGSPIAGISVVTDFLDLSSASLLNLFNLDLGSLRLL